MDKQNFAWTLLIHQA